MKNHKSIVGLFVVLLFVLGTTPVMGRDNHQPGPDIGGEICGLTYVGHLDTPGTAVGIAVSGNYAYIADIWSLRIVDISNPASPIEVSFVPASSVYSLCNEVAVAENYVYCAGFAKLHIVDVSNPAGPVLVGTGTAWGSPKGLVVAGTYAYFLENHDTGSGYLYRLFVYNVSNPATPSLIGVHTLTSEPADVDVEGGYAYVANDSSGLRVVDVSTANAPVEVGYYDPSWYAEGVSVVGSYAYVAACGQGLRILDISSPAIPTEVGNLGIYEYCAEEVSVAWKYAFLAGRGNGVKVVDVTNPTKPTMIWGYGTTDARDIALSNGFIYVADADNGLVILRISSLSGQAFDLLDQPIADVTITATGGLSTQTDASGRFAFDNLDPGTYTLTASKTGYDFSPASLEVTLPPIAHINFVGNIYKIYAPMVLKK
jgi:hypothetical protein